MKIKELLVEYRFKHPLPPNVKKLYADHFTPNEKKALQQFDSGWYDNDHDSGCKELCSKFKADRRYPMGTPAKSAEVHLRKFRDRYRITFDFYDHGDHVDDAGFRPSDVQHVDFASSSINEFKRKVFFHLQAMLLK